MLDLLLRYFVTVCVGALQMPDHQGAAKAAPRSDGPPTVFRHVNVLSMETDRILQDQAVVVRNGTIVSIGAVDQLTTPPDARIVGGKNRFLLPGLIDMHMHLNGAADEDHLLMSLCPGRASIPVWGSSGWPWSSRMWTRSSRSIS